MIENNGEIHAFSPRAGVDNLLRSFFSQNFKYTVNVVIAARFSH